MIIAFAWRLRWEDEVFGPRPFVSQLYEAARYMSADAVWEWQDASGDWVTHLSVGDWRQYIALVRRHYFHESGGAPIDDCSYYYTYYDLSLRLSEGRTKKKLRLLSLRRFVKSNAKPFKWWVEKTENAQAIWEDKMKKRKLRAEQEIAALEKELDL